MELFWRIAVAKIKKYGEKVKEEDEEEKLDQRQRSNPSCNDVIRGKLRFDLDMAIDHRP